MVLLLIGKLHRIIWNIRCEVAKKGCSEHADILKVYKSNLKKFILMEKRRLDIKFLTSLRKNSALCYF